MLYIVTSLITEVDKETFTLVGVASSKEQAAKLAVSVYRDYNKNASFTNLEMIEEWLRTRRKYSFRRDKAHRLQLALTEAEATDAPLSEVIFSEEREAEELMRRVSEALYEGHHAAERTAAGELKSCTLTK